MSECMARRARPLLGTLVDVRIESCTGDAAKAFEAAFAAAAAVHSLMSGQDPASDVSRLNRAPVDEPVCIHPWTYRVLERACELARATEGLFDPCVAPMLQEAGYLPRFRRTRERWGDYRSLELADGCMVRMHAPVQITLDGIAKGFAVDMAVAALREAGVDAGVVNAGGDMRIFGPIIEPVFVRDPGDPSRMARIGTLREAALATSSVYFSCRSDANASTSHIFHPVMGDSFVEPASASVIASDCMTADALCKPLLLDAVGTQSLLTRIGAKGVVIRSPGMIQ